MERKDQNKVMDALRSIDFIDRIEAPPFLYNKIRSRLQANQKIQPKWIFSFLLQPAYSLTILLIAVLLNVLALATFKLSKHSNDNDAIETFAREYSINAYSAYDKSF